MLNRIIKYSLDNRLIVLVVALLLIVGGWWTASRMDIDVFPDLNAPTVVIMTEAHGMAPEEVEQLVTFPIETAINGSTGLRRVRSASSMGFSIVWAEFDWGMDVYNARQIISEKIVTVSDQLPKSVDSPILAPQSSLMGEIMVFAITAETTSPMALRSIADWSIRPRLLSVGGVAQVATIGGDYKEFQILVNPEKLRFYNITMQELIETCENSNENVPGGFIEEYSNNYLVRGMARTNNPLEIGNSLIKIQNGFPVKIKDVATVKTGAAPKIGDGSYRAGKAVVFTVTKQPNVNTIVLTDNIEKALLEIKKTLPADVEIHTDVFEQSQFIQTAVNNVARALMEGAVFVIIILALFLMNYRTTIISVISIPISLLIAILAMKLMGFTINTMSLGGMAIAIGSLVDDAIIDVENVYKRLRQNAVKIKAEQQNKLLVVYNASTEIRASIMNATLIIIVAFLPLFFLSGMEGRMLRPLGIAYIVSLFASLLVAITITPVLCSLMLTNDKRLKKNKDGSWLERNLQKWYGHSLKWSMNHKKVIIGSALGLLVASILILTTFGRSFLPSFNEGTLTINVAAMPGIALTESDIIGKQAEQILLGIPEIKTVERRTGRAELAEHSFGANISEIDAPFTLSDRDRETFLADVRSKLSVIQGVSIEVGQPISHRMNHMLSGSNASIAIKLFGTNLGQMFEIASKIKGDIQGINGIADLSVEQQIETPQIQILPKRNMLAKYGISINQFTKFVDFALAGEKVSDVFENERSYDLVLRFDDKYRDNIEAIKNAMIDTGNGKKIPLYYVADVVSTTGPYTINRENVKRKIVVSANVAGRDIRGVVNDIKANVDKNIELPEGYHIEYGGQFESEAAASKILLFASLIALLVIYLLLYQEFKKVILTSVILVNLPLATIGGVFAIWFTSGIMSIPSIIGFITLFGIATRNGILLVSRYEALNKQGVPLKERILRGSVDRLNPILMTALTAALALIPLALAGGESGNEIQSPMAVVILGGLLSSTLLNIFVVPGIYYLTSKRKSNLSQENVSL